MTEYKMTNEWRKILDDFMDEYDHLVLCKRCKPSHYEPIKRTYNNDTDMLAVVRKIRDAGEWTKFYRYAGKHWLQDEEAWKRDEPLEVWLFLDNPERACCLAAMFLEGQG